MEEEKGSTIYMIGIIVGVLLTMILLVIVVTVLLLSTALDTTGETTSHNDEEQAAEVQTTDDGEAEVDEVEPEATEESSESTGIPVIIFS